MQKLLNIEIKKLKENWGAFLVFGKMLNEYDSM